MVYAVIDTNVIVSSLKSAHPDSATVRVMDAVYCGKVKIIEFRRHTGAVLRNRWTVMENWVCVATRRLRGTLRGSLISSAP